MDTSLARAVKKQTVVFVRHGVAEHNILDPHTGARPDLTNPTLFDPPLVRDGKFQAVEAGERLRQWWQGREVELVVTSPNTRCLQTAALAFLPGNFYTKKGKEPSIVCMESVREAYGTHYPDRRRTKSLLSSQWPSIQFEAEMTEQDEDWKPDVRETYNDVVQRVNQFLDKLVKRPETNITVISHGVWIECCFRAHSPSVLDGGVRVRNCDLFAAECISVDGSFQLLQNVRRIQ